jgi:hypothetical protein
VIRTQATAPSLQWWMDHQHALTVPCPDGRCHQLVGRPCVRADGEPLTGPPAHGNRLRDADRAAGLPVPAHPAAAPVRKVDMQPERLDHHQRPCNHCRGPILWAKTDGDRLMPVDAEPAADGNVLLTVERDHLRAGVLGANQAAGARDHGLALYRHHKLSCPHADRWCRSPRTRRSRRR